MFSDNTSLTIKATSPLVYIYMVRSVTVLLTLTNNKRTAENYMALKSFKICRSKLITNLNNTITREYYALLLDKLTAEIVKKTAFEEEESVFLSRQYAHSHFDGSYGENCTKN